MSSANVLTLKTQDYSVTFLVANSLNEAFDVCSKSWGIVTRSLRDLITTAKGQPLTLDESK